MKATKKYIIALILVISVVGAGIASFIILNPSKKSYESKIRDLIAKYQIPSLAAGIIINDSLVWANGFGEQPDLDTVYMIGSITKTFTATAILQLNESNLINLDNDVNNYLPFDVRNPNYQTIPITTRMLLTHTAGLPQNLFWSLEYYFDNDMIQWINENLDLGGNISILEPRPTLEEFLNGSLTPGGQYYDPYNWPLRPGSQFLYSNVGFQLLSYLVEQVANQSLESYVQENIFEPLNMTNSGYNYIDFIDKNAIPYEWHNGENLAYPHYNINVTGAGSIRSTVPDKAKYIITYMNQGEINGTQLLSPDTIELMHSTQVSLTRTTTEGFELTGYGLGWFLYEGGFKGHGGATPGFSSNMFFNATNGYGAYGVILMFNRGSALTYDEVLINNFIPAINALFLKEAENLFQQTLPA